MVLTGPACTLSIPARILGKRTNPHTKSGDILAEAWIKDNAPTADHSSAALDELGNRASLHGTLVSLYTEMVTSARLVMSRFAHCFRL